MQTGLIPRRLFPRSALLVALGVLGACARPPERPEFFAERAWSYLGIQMSYGPRYYGHRGKASERTVALLREHLGYRADTLIEQRFTATLDGQRHTLTNLFARFDPEKPRRILLAAHWDTRRRAERSPDPGDRGRPVPGANDGASGTAVLMELAQLFHQQRPEVGVDLLFTDGDDYGGAATLLGTRHFLANLPPGYRPAYAVVVNLVGDALLRIPLQPGAGEADPTRRVLAAAAALGRDTLFIRGPSLADGAHLALREAGIPTVAVIDGEYGPGNVVWHTVDDHVTSVQPRSLFAAGEVLAELVYTEPAR